VPGAFLILALSLTGILALAALAGYYVGSSDRDRAAATSQAVELARQYQLGLDDLTAGRPTLAIQRFEFILSLSPNYPGAAERLAEARAAIPPTAAATVTPLPSPTLIITVGPETALVLFQEAQTAFDDKQWDQALQKIGALRVIDPDYERAAVRNILFNSLRNRGIDYINAGKLELGLADLDQASKIGTLDEEAQQYQQWAAIYIAGVSYWGLNWPRTVETFELLYTIAPYFRDTIARLHDAHMGYAYQLETQGIPCDAVTQYAAALDLQFDQSVEDRRLAAESACQFGTATPDGTLTPFPTLEGTPTETPTPDGLVTETPVPTDTETPTVTP
jgi:tetratricopeptide (TPR) repeat protein